MLLVGLVVHGEPLALRAQLKAVTPHDLVQLCLPADAGLLPPALMEPLRRAYPNIVLIERKWAAPQAELMQHPQELLEAFKTFYRQVGGGRLEDEQETVLREVLRLQAKGSDPPHAPPWTEGIPV